MWGKAGKKIKAREAVQKTVASTLLQQYKKVKKDPEDFYNELLENNTTHFTPPELERLLAAFTRVTQDRLQGTHFYEIVENEMGWSNLLLRKQLFKAFDFDGHGDINFTEFAEGYSAMLRGTVPELIEFAWRVYHVQGPPDVLSLTDMYAILRLALGGLEEIRQKQGLRSGWGGEFTRFPERTARNLLESTLGDRQTPLTKQEFANLVLKQRRLVDCIIPGFELIPQDPLHRACEVGELQECLHLLEVDQMNVDGRDGLAFPTTPLHLAARFGHEDVVALLLNKGANTRLLNRDGESVLELAVKHGQIKVCEALLNFGVDVHLTNEKGKSVFHTAAHYGQYKVLRMLMPHLESAVVQLRDDEGKTPMHDCAESDNWMIADIFLEFHKLGLSDMDCRDLSGRTPLMVAADSGAFRMGRKLMEMGADPSLADKAGLSVLNISVRRKDNEAMVNTLLNDGRVNVDLPDDLGVTPICACVATMDPRILRSLLQHDADVNIQEKKFGYSPLHKAVLLEWVEGVDALLGPDINAQILRDKDGYTPLDYCTNSEIMETVRDYIELKYPTYHPGYPIDFVFGMVFDEGAWELQTDGDKVGTRVLKRPRVSRALADQRVKHKMIGKDPIRRQLRKAGLFVLEEKVLIQEKILGVVKGDIRQYTFFRIACPLYRLQQEAMKMRVQAKRKDLNKFEDFFIDKTIYPDLGFVPFSLSERQKVMLNVIQSSSTQEANLLSHIKDHVSVDEPFTSGIAIAYYLKYKVVHDFVCLHEPNQRESVLELWHGRNLKNKVYWYDHITNYIANRKTNKYGPLQKALDYFGHKVAFYFGFITFYTNWLVAPATAGIFIFALEFIDPRFASATADTVEDSTKFDDQYDHPMFIVYSFFLCAWSGVIVWGWMQKQHELAFRWKVDDYFLRNPNPNVLSTSPVRLQFVDGSWVYRSAMSKAQKKEQLKFICLVTVPVTLLMLLLVAAWNVGAYYLLKHMEDDQSLFENYGQPNEKRNTKGDLAFYAITALQALCIWILNTAYSSLGIWLTRKENWENMQKYDNMLAARVMGFMMINNYSSLFYYAYYVRDLDQVAAQLAAIMILVSVIQFSFEYGLPYLKGLRPESEEAQEIREARKAANKKKGKKDQKEEDPESVALVVAEEGEAKAGAGGGGDKGGGAAGGPGGIAALAGGGNKVGGVADMVAMLKKGQEDEEDEDTARDDLKETLTAARDEILMDDTQIGLEFASMIVQFGYVTMFGAAWPLAAVAALVNNFLAIRMDMWKFCCSRRPMAERTNSIGTFWMAAFEVVAVLGMVNHCFLMGITSNTFEEYFFAGATLHERFIASFTAENIVLFFYVCVRLKMIRDKEPRWVVYKRKEPLRFIRDAYRAGCALRERRYRMMLGNADVALAVVAEREDVDEGAAERYLTLVRFIDSLPPHEHRAMLFNSTSTIQSITTTVALKMRGKLWTDEGEMPTSKGLLRQLVPVTDLRQCYVLGKRVREAAYTIWENHQNVTVMGSKAATIMCIRQFACIQVGCTLPQAERYVRLVRYVDKAAPKVYERLRDLTTEHPDGLMSVLGLIGQTEVDDPGEPVPSELGRAVEPLVYAKRAYERADVLRRKMFERWILDKHLSHDDLIDSVCEEVGAFKPQLERYLLVKRYCDGLDDRKRNEVLKLARSQTLVLCAHIRKLIAEGQWRDPGEASFTTYTPPIVMESLVDEDDF